MLTKRHDFIQYFINKNTGKNYLEIGVDQGNVFFSIQVKNKMAVDPEFKFDNFKKLTRYIAKPNRHALLSNLNAKYFEITSDNFFAKHKPSEKFDVCFIDGMHEFDYSTRDAINCLDHLTDNGVIILHDCNPLNKEEEISFADWQKRGFTGGWKGDVWKTIVYLKCFRKDLDVCVVDTDQGLGIVRKKKNATDKAYAFNFKDEAEIRNLDYAFFEQNRVALLGLMSVEDFNKTL
jgi:hypothetical protein